MSVKQLQKEFYQDVVDVESNPENYLDNASFSAQDLLQIYRNQYFLTLGEALAKSYACIKRLVGEDFFNQLAREYIATHPSKTGNIIDYGDEFPDFIKTNTHCKNLPYLSDIAKFEHLYERCYFSGAVYFMRSTYPVIEIWQLDENSAQLDLSGGGDYLKIYRQNHEVLVEKITQQQYEERV